MAKSSEEIKWESPPSRGSYNWDEIAEKLRENPGEWALIFKNDRRSIAVALAQGSVKAMVEGFEFMTRNNRFEDRDGARRRVCDLYIRYVGKGR